MFAKSLTSSNLPFTFEKTARLFGDPLEEKHKSPINLQTFVINTLVFQNPPNTLGEDRYLEPLKAEPQEVFLGPNTHLLTRYLED